ncbi:complement factor H isoform X2 [Ranitomeya variabilis]|uniref:complement factor H isoform X2 n=1 Tax=Ranitomeya variabilis TaxID=490064 RepID=UPI004057753D
MSLLGYVLLLASALCCTAEASADGSCKRPERMVEAELVGDWENESYPGGTQAVYQCRPGYTRQGTIKKACISGEWQYFGRKGECKKKSCGHPGDIPFGSFELTNEESFIFGAVVEYTCDEGYRLASRERTRECTATGWSNYLPHCDVMNCPPIEASGNLDVLSTSYDEEYSVGQVVRFACKLPTLKLNGPSEIFCTSDGKWNLDPPTCTEIKCNRPIVDKGSVNKLGQLIFNINEIIQVTCEQGYRPNRNGESTCTKDDWFPKPSCTEITCNAPQVQKGSVDARKAVYRHGEEIVVKCDYGYVLQPEPNKLRKCTINGWDPAPNCVSKKCDEPDIKNGELYYNYYFPRSPRSTIQYTCNTNYLSLVRREYWGRTECTNFGWNPEPKCLRQCFNNKAYFENAELVNLQSNYLEGEEVNFRCKSPSRTPDGKTTGIRTCLPNGEFTTAKCSITCKAPRLLHGKYTFIEEEFANGAYLQYECDKGYMTQKHNLFATAQCLDGKWSEYPMCIDITCKYGLSTYKDKHVAPYACPLGQRPKSDLVQCFNYGWGPPPICQNIGCNIPEASNLVRSPHFQSYEINDKVEFSCKQGFERDGSRTSTCTENGWKPTLPTCQNIGCNIPEASNLVRSPHFQSYEINDKVEFSCEQGFERDGSRTSTCTENGWKPTLPTCQKQPGQSDATNPPPGEKEVEMPLDPDSVASMPASKDKQENRKKCARAHNPKFAEITNLKEAYYSNDEATIKCNRGYKMYGNATIRCIDGIWEQPPECYGVTDCRKPPRVINGYLTTDSKQEKYVTDDIVKYQCDPGFHISGSNKIICVGGQWSGSPECTEDSCEGAPVVSNAFVVQDQKIYKHGESAEFTCKDNYGFSGGDSAKCVEGKWMNVPKCVVTACNQPPTVQNARIKEQIKNMYASGDTVTYSCNKDYSLEQSLTGEAKCENTEWINLPVCRKIGDQCGPPPTVQSGDTVDIRKNSYKTRDVVEYKCKNYYLLKGNKNVQCMNGVWGEAPVCLEPCTAKEKSMEDNNIHLKWLGERKLYSTHGDTIEFDCKSGFESPPNTQMRVTCEHGKLEYPKCYKRGFCVLQQSAMIGNNIHYNVSTVVDNGQVIKFQCNEEMTPEKGLEAKCTLGNIQYPKCTAAKSCKAPEIQNGFLKTPEDSYDSGHYAEFQCNKDHVKNNLLSPKCENGKWTHHPVCYSPCEVSSEDLSGSNIQPVSTDIGKSYKHGEELQVSCKQGYKRPNQPSFFIECNDGKFKYSRCFSGKTCRIDQDDLDGNNLELDEVHNTDVFYEIGETIMFKCKNGFSHRDRQPTGTCAEKELIYPKCIESSV